MEQNPRTPNIEKPYEWFPFLICPGCGDITRASIWVDESITIERFACEGCGFEAFEGDEEYPSENHPFIYQINSMDKARFVVCSMIDAHPDLAEQPVQTLITAMADIVRNATGGVL